MPTVAPHIHESLISVMHHLCLWHRLDHGVPFLHLERDYLSNRHTRIEDRATFSRHPHERDVDRRLVAAVHDPAEGLKWQIRPVEWMGIQSAVSLWNVDHPRYVKFEDMPVEVFARKLLTVMH